MDIKPTLHRLGRSRRDAMLGGVCAGFAETTDTPAWLWRAGAIFVGLWAGSGVLLYLVLWVVMPFRNENA